MFIKTSQELLLVNNVSFLMCIFALLCLSSLCLFLGPPTTKQASGKVGLSILNLYQTINTQELMSSRNITPGLLMK